MHGGLVARAGAGDPSTNVPKAEDEQVIFDLSSGVKGKECIS